MKVGIIPNTTKDNILSVLENIIRKLNKYELDFIISDVVKNEIRDNFSTELNYMQEEELCRRSDLILSIGGDGTVLSTAYKVRNKNIPIAGINIGKLGFLAEFDCDNLDELLNDIKVNQFKISKRVTLDAKLNNKSEMNFYAINDIVIDRGSWLKMIELTIKVDNDSVATFFADGLIIATPTGSTGYSISTGGPIVYPLADVITITPIAPHNLSMRPIVIPGDKKIQITVNSPFEQVRITCDGQRVEYVNPSFTIEIYKSENYLNLIHTNGANYFSILRKKMLWGLDTRITGKQ